MVDAVVLSGSGYAGAEVLRLLAAHPELRVVATTAHSAAGQAVGSLHPHLARAYPELSFVDLDQLELPGSGPVAIFGCGPHGGSARDTLHAMTLAGERPHRVVELSADFRHDAATFEAVYGVVHPAPELLDRVTCAPPDLEPGPADLACQPGCFTTAVTLAVAPLVRSGLVAPDVQVSAVTGSTGSGRNPKPGTHHPVRHGNLWAYSALDHRHVPEMERLTGAAVTFVPHSGPFARGIEATCFLRRTGGSAEDLREALYAFYAGSPFVHVQDTPPKLSDVVGTNRCHVGLLQRGDRIVVSSVIDNLIKGAAGGAVQWMNRLHGWPDATGLEADPIPWS